MSNHNVWGLASIIALFLLSVCAIDVRNPLKDPKICGRPECETENNKFRYNAGIKYKYDYRSHVRSEFLGTGQNKSDVFISASVVLIFPKKCEGILKIQEVELRETAVYDSLFDDDDNDSSGSTDQRLHTKSSNFAADLERNDLRFAFHDGVIGELCPEDNEENWVTNFKRGILSTIQNSMQRFDIDYKTTETDVSGTCNVDYVLAGTLKTSLSIKKTRDISTCINRYKTHSFLQTTPYDFRKQYAVWPLLHSTSYCNITIDHNIFQDVICFERHELVPFSNNGSGAVTVAKIRLTLADEEQYELPNQEEEVKIKIRVPLLFNHYPTPKPTHGEIKTSRDLLKQMCKLGFPNIQREFIEVFTKFLGTARVLSHTALKQLVSRASSICENGKNHVLESLSYVGSTASVQLMTEEITRKSVSDAIAQKWLTSLAFLPRPDEDMLESFYNLIKYAENIQDPIYVLSSTSVAHTFCRNHPDCITIPAIQNIVKFLEDSISEKLNTDVSKRNVREKIIVLLKGLGNIGLFSKTFRKKIQEVIIDPTKSNDIRLEAVSSHRRVDCMGSRDFFLDLYRNYSMEAEIRIGSYIQAMRCPDYISIKLIKSVIKHEVINQVGSFVWSHLTNLAQSSSPVKVEAQGLLSDIDLNNKFNLDRRSFSRNFEHSLFFDEYNVGASSDANVIFGTESYLPRTASYNFTVNLFGESINVFELTAHMQGFEHMVESIFGPNGAYNEEGFKRKLGYWTNYFKDKIVPEDFDYFEKLNLRLKRGAQETEAVSDEDDDSDYDFESDGSDAGEHNVKKRSTGLERELEADVRDLNYNLRYDFNNPRAAIGLKMFGNDIRHKSIEGIYEIGAAISQLNPMNQLTSLLSGKEITYSKSGVFLEASYEVPLSSGMPLSLTAYGASSVDLRMSGAWSGKNFIENPDFEVVGKMKPSVSLDVTGTMQVDFFYGESGIVVKNNLYSSSAIEAKLRVKENKLASFHLILPQDRNDIFSAKSELLVKINDVGIPQKGIEKRYSNATCTWPFIDQAIGLTLCSNYSVPDVSNSSVALPSILLCGPINLDVHMDKADITAKTFLFEYRLTEKKDKSIASFVFTTPGSAIARVFNGNISSDPDTYNVSMSFVNGKTVHSATGTYKNTPDEKSLEAYVHMDGKKSFALDVGMNKTEIRNGFIYYPRFLLDINNEQVANLSGEVRMTNKKNIMQHSVVLSYRMKKFEAKLSGNVVNTGLTSSAKLELDYRFHDGKLEKVDFEGEWADRTQTSSKYIGFVKLNSTAYPVYNFASNLTLRHILGHVELKVDINNAKDFMDPKYTLGLRLMLARQMHDDLKYNEGRTSVIISMKRPISNLDYKFSLKHDERFKNGTIPVHNTLVGFRYAPDKEATFSASLVFPNKNSIDSAFNLTFPGFDSCVVGLRILEKAKKEYTIDFKGKWFSGHSIRIQGNYQDKTTLVKKFYRIKLEATSPHFNTTNINFLYSRDEISIKFEIQAEYSKQPYEFLLALNDLGFGDKHFKAEVKFRDKLYSLTANKTDQLFIELHIDRLRDIHLILRGIVNELVREVGIELMWDANRDPTQKLVVSVDFNTPSPRTYNGGFVISYPERSISGTFDLSIPSPTYNGTARLGWGAQDIIEFSFDSGFSPGKIKNMWLNTELRTPFGGWNKNALCGGLYYENNLFLSNVSVLWADSQQLAFGILTNYEIGDPNLEVELRINLNSTVKDIPTIEAEFKHDQDQRHFDTFFIVKHATNEEKSNVFSIRSGWSRNFNQDYRNISGSISLRSPFEGYKTGALATKFLLSTKKYLQGAADLNLEDKKFTFSVEGHIKKLTDSMLVANITTPIEKFKKIIGRFGINEAQRHFVAEVRAPAGALGLELKFVLVSIADFDVIFNLETPAETFQKVMVIGKINPETVDLRGGWNKVMLGYVGISRMQSLKDFEYSYKVFTPLEKFEENGLVVRFIHHELFDFEASLKIAQYKLGVVMSAKPKPEYMRLLGSQRSKALLSGLLDDGDDFSEVLKANSLSESSSSSEDSSEENHLEEFEEDFANFIGNMELDTLVWPTFYGEIDFEEIPDSYVVSGQIVLPQGAIKMNDYFYYPDMLNMKNKLEISTPFNISKIVAKYMHAVDLGSYYISGVEVAFQNQLNWLEVGYTANYTVTVDEEEHRTYDILLKLKTPFISAPRVQLRGSAALEESIYRGNISMKTIDTEVSIAGSIESDDSYTDALFALSLATPIIPKYGCVINFKKEFSDTENSVDFSLKIDDDGTINNLQADAIWHAESSNYISAKGSLKTNILPVELIKGSFLLEKSQAAMSSSLDISLAFGSLSGQVAEFKASAQRKKDVVNIELNSPIKSFENITVEGTLTPVSQPGKFNFNGRLTRDKDFYTVDGTVSLISDLPVDANLRFVQTSRNTLGYLTYSLKNTEGISGKAYRFKVMEGDTFLQVNGSLSLMSKVHWSIHNTIVSSAGILSRNPNDNRIDFQASVVPDINGKITGKSELNAPLKHLGMDKITVEGEAAIKSMIGSVQMKYDMPVSNGQIGSSWAFVVMENMQFGLDSTIAKLNTPPRSLRVGLKYTNPGRSKQRMGLGANLMVDSKWHLETNASLVTIAKGDISTSLAFRLPKPVGDIHRLTARYRGNLDVMNFDLSKPNIDISYDAKYESEEVKRRFVSRGQYRNVTDLQALIRAEWEHSEANGTFETNMQMLRKGIRREFSARVETPLHKEDTLTASGSYDRENIYHVISGNVNYPASRQVATTDVSFSSLSNMKGHINSTTPFANITWLRSDVDFTTTGSQSNRYLKATWPKDSAFIDIKSAFVSRGLERDHHGTIKVEVPLAKTHYTNIEYALKERQETTTGYCNVDYNKRKVLSGKYNCKSEVRTGFSKDSVDIVLENELKPIGIVYVHQVEGPESDAPVYDFKRAEIYDLGNSRNVNVTGELHVRTTPTGQQYKIVAIHPNRTVILTSDYDYQDIKRQQRSKLELSPTIWIAYDLRLRNLTQVGNESQNFDIEVSYPKRNLSASGWYSVTDDTFDSDLSFKWSKDGAAVELDEESEETESYDYYGTTTNEEEKKDRVMKASLTWRSEPLIGLDRANQSVLFAIKHPSFSKDITFRGSYYRNPVDLIKGRLEIDYCEDPKHLLTLESGIRDMSTIVGHRNYTINVFATHPVSQLDLNATGSISGRPGIYATSNWGRYKRGYFPLQEGLLTGRLYLENKEIYYKKMTPYKTFKIWLKTGGKYPVYTLNGTFENSPEVNSTGRFYVNLNDKFVQLAVNLTPDASQNLQMLGSIPDARSASLDLWRDYEEIRIVDVSYYLRMNHSRLVTSQLIWRPKLKSEIKSAFRQLTGDVYDSFSENVDFWVKSIHTESNDTFNDVWQNAYPKVQKFMDDLGDLKVIENDIVEFRTFLNQSYEANDFYIKTVVNFTFTVLDELAIRNHIESLPDILNEIWNVLGNSGAALRKNILWLIENIKLSYKNAVEIIARIFHGGAMDYVTVVVEKMVTNYDNFIKKLHLSFIKYVENMWGRFTTALADQWNRFLERIQPSIMKFIHYTEALLWNMSNEVFDFLHSQTNQLTNSPHFDKVSKFTHDMDLLYQDIMVNDIITNIKKYSLLGYQFLKDKYFKIVPFSKELQNITDELILEIQQLKKHELVRFIFERIDEIETKIQWFAEELHVEERIQQFWVIVQNKIAHYHQTALQTDDKYREAKTRFVFDPDTGLIQLEQKLPMTWHAFNETPKYEEISEYKMLTSIQSVFDEYDFSILGLYQECMEYLDPRTWLPPFKARSLFIGSRHYITFDKRFVSLDLKYEYISDNKKPNQCSYLLAHDYIDSNFTLVLEPSIVNHQNKLLSTRKFALLAENKILDIDMVGSAIRVSRNITTSLPIQIGETVIYQEADILTVESSKGFQLHCNLQFDLCWFEVTGWYFGKTAGILGTINNEQFDDFTVPSHQISRSKDEFIDKWSFKQCHGVNEHQNYNFSMEVFDICNAFFVIKTSQFSSCFPYVDPNPFAEMCMDMGINSISDFTHEEHPAQKGACAVALAYIDTCEAEKKPLRIPDICVHCDLNNGSYVPEGTFINLKDDEVPQTSDIVFIVEAKSCNKNLTNSKNLATIINTMNIELAKMNITDNRYAVVAFGGSAPFDHPRSIVYNSKIFTDSTNVKHHLDHVRTGYSNTSDMFEAIHMASNLVFRPGASKTFILIPCSNCSSMEMKFDYSTILQILREGGVNLHILIDQDFDLEKKRIERGFFGFDREHVFTKKYPDGDKELRRHLHLPKTLGMCTALAIETKGAVFSANKLRPGQKNPTKKIAGSFATRIAKTATPRSCQTCECTGHNNGIAFMICTRCLSYDASNMDADDEILVEDDENWGAADYYDES